MSEFEYNLFLDLLPIYIDGKVSQETKEYIINHIEIYPECKAVYDSMISDIDLKENPINIERKVITPIQRLGRFVGIYLITLIFLAVLLSIILIYGA